uniref:O-antigen polymerase n=1 Tax=Bursaphelenchus xylophilus TaxID=6326 RepID=A0A1I7S5H2_BURXY
MLILAILDMALLPGSAFATSYFLMKGTVFCDHPTMIYFIGVWLLALWMGYALYAIILALNRCVSFTRLDMYFKGNWEYFWLISPWFMILYHFLYGTPVIFTPQYYGWFFNPHMGYFEDIDGQYFNWAHTIENIIVATAIPLLYVVFFFYVKKIGKGRTNEPRDDKNLFGQILTMSLIISAAAVTYFVMQLSFTPYWVKCTGHYGWIIVQALWMGYALYAIILALNRCAAFTTMDVYFKGNWQYFWLIGPWFMVVYQAAFGSPGIFIPQYYGWFFNPHMGYFEDTEGRYFNWAHSIENIVVATVIPLLYLIFYFYLFAQIFIMSLIISVAAMVYFFMQTLFLPSWVKSMGHYGWIVVQGCPAVIYLTGNRTFQKKLFKKTAPGSNNSLSARQQKPVDTKTLKSLNSSPLP